MFLLGANSAGLMNKKESFERYLNLFLPGVFFVQETKLRKKNKIKHPNYVTFEYLRENNNGGGLLTAVHKSLNPVSVSTDTEEEVLVVEATIANKKVRLINAYGPQEDEKEDIKEDFYNRIDQEVKTSKLAGAMVCIEMDANAKLGSSFINGDPKEKSKNGRLLEDVVVENDLIVVNAMDICKGVITRYRQTVNSEEKSVIDYFIVCRRFFKIIKSMVVDEERIYSLTKYSGRTGNRKIKESDHNTLILELNIAWKNIIDDPVQRIEIFNFKNDENFKRFTCLSNNNDVFKELFNDENEDLEVSSQKWLKNVNKLISITFSKIRIKRGKVNPNLEQLFIKKENTKAKIAVIENDGDREKLEELNDELEDIMEEISEHCSDRNKKIVDQYIGDSDFGLEGFNQVKTWSLKNKLSPKNVIEPPAAKKDKDGKVVTDRKELENLYLETYKTRLAPNKIAEDLAELKTLKEYLFKVNKKLAEKETSTDWNMDDLDKVLKKLKNNKARDAHGHIYEIYKYAGLDLKASMLRMFNLMKKKRIYPTIFQASNISSFYKKSGDKTDLNNDRGVFNVVKLRSILDKLIYNDIYYKIDLSMSSSNIGARRNRNIRDHLFVINGILNDVQQTRNKPGIDVGIYDIAKCFDKMWYSETGNDIFKAGVQDDKFLLIANSNKDCQVAIKTPWGGITDRITLNELEMQGTVLSNIKCSVQVDSLGKDCITENKAIYKYKDCISIPPLAMIDDVITVSNCGADSVKTNAIVQAKVQCKQLELGQKKCFNMHAGQKSKHLCPTLSVHGDIMLLSEKQKYLGDILTTTGRINENIEARYKKGLGKVNEILGILQEVSFGAHFFKMALLFRDSILINSMLCSSEVLYGINNSHIEKLEQVDRIFFRRLFQVPNSTAIEAFYLETSCLPIRFILMGRRLLYYWDILHKNEVELVKKVFNSQKKFAVKNDWVLQVQKDFGECNINLSEDEIARMSKYRFKKLIKEKIRILAANYLIAKKEKHSKSENLEYSKEMQVYLRNESLKLRDKLLLFRLRNRLIDVKMNFKGKYNNELQCRLCKKADESQLHLTQCEVIISDSHVKKALEGYSYIDTFSNNLRTQEHMINAWQKILKIWKSKDNYYQASPDSSGASYT